MGGRGLLVVGHLGDHTQRGRRRLEGGSCFGVLMPAQVGRGLLRVVSEVGRAGGTA